jgi:hypothetical protein
MIETIQANQESSNRHIHDDYYGILAQDMSCEASKDPLLHSDWLTHDILTQGVVAVSQMVNSSHC